jgi:hypothetical protein
MDAGGRTRRWGAALRGLRGNPWAVMTTTCLGYFITILNSTSVSIAVPEIQAGLGAGLSEVLWSSAVTCWRSPC